MSLTSDTLQFNLNDTALDLLNAAIASHHQIGTENNNLLIDTTNTPEDKETTPKQKTSPGTHTKRELDKDEQTTITAPKRAGRKPLEKSATAEASLDPKQKRKAQNRAAQRAFRDRKEKHVAELQARIAELEALNAKKDEDLVKENEKLKEQLKKLQEENYALKGAQFTFEFPVADHQHPVYHPSDAQYQTTTSSSSISSSNSYSGEDGTSSSAEHSPLSNPNTHDDDSPTTTDAQLFASTPLQFGPIVDNTPDFLAMNVTHGFGNDLIGGHNFSVTNSDLVFPTGDLFHGKDDPFANYQAPSTNNLNDGFLFANENLSNLFGPTDDIFSDNQFALNTQFGLPETPAIRRNKISAEKKKCLIDKLKKGQQEGKYVYQVHQEIQQQCPDFDLDALCDELKMKAQCSLSTHLVTDKEVEAFVKCLDKA
ncbi:hypothetical protein EDC96DRAFT_499819 [Choanephora cucurbitarum]|nr:hypothetical protein EDC96DRAFT_499819 [Choanephora cucurbitarum]